MNRFLAALLSLLLGLGCLPAAAERAVTVFAAASLAGVLENIVPEGARFSYGGSGAMARQVAAGAPADLVILASPEWMAWLQAKGVSGAAEPVIVARNALVVVGPAGAPPLGAAGALRSRLGGGRLAMGQRDAVPAGVYARQWLQAAALWPALEPRLAETDNVRAALTLVARGAVPLGVVYATDARAEPGVKVIYEVPQDAHDPILYPALALTEAGAALLAQITAPDAIATLTAHGFVAP